MSLLRSSSDARNATTHSENTAKLCAFKGKILTIAVKLRERGYSETYLATMIRALLEISRNVNLRNPSEVSLYIARKKVKDSFKANLCDFYKHYADYCGIHFIKPKYRRDHKLPWYYPKKMCVEPEKPNCDEFKHPTRGPLDKYFFNIAHKFIL